MYFVLSNAIELLKRSYKSEYAKKFNSIEHKLEEIASGKHESLSGKEKVSKKEFQKNDRIYLRLCE